MNKIFIDRLIDELNAREIDAVFIAPSEVLAFLLGHSPYLCERFQGLFVTKNAELFYISSLLCREEMERCLGNEGEVFAWSDSDDFTICVKKAFDKYSLNGKTIALCPVARAGNWIRIKEATKVKTIPGKELLENIRIIKTKEEIANLKKAAKLADDVFSSVLPYIKAGATELDIKEKIIELFDNMGIGESFTPIIASGANSSMPHYHSYDRKFEKEDIVLMDFGCKVGGMCSDISRTVFIGAVSDKQAEIYNIVKEANEAGEAAIKEGVKASQVDFAARKIIEDRGYGDKFLNRLGHGIGYSVHEGPDIKGSNKTVLKEGMAFSVEPGIYLSGEFGIRIEDIALVSNEGADILNKADKKIIIL